MKKYIPKDFEAKWQAKWEKSAIYKTENHSKKPKKYILDMFPYPSGDGLHVGHFKIYTASDILARYHRAKGFNVLHPMGWDAFGLPAENYAIKTGIHPKITTEKNINKIRSQMKMVGLSYDWDREVDTTDPKYYKWTQWIFLKLFEKGLAYEDEAPINWCPKDKTGLSNEEVVNGQCDRCGTRVERKVIRQWILGITKYADRLLSDIEELDWPEFIKEMQRNWIGKSEGTRIKFKLKKDQFIEAFTTRIDTVFGVTALVLAPEHEKLMELVTDEHRQTVLNYLEATKNKSDLERTELNKQKTGVFTGSYAINPVNNKSIPIWVADYVLGFYGTGAVMLVPGHDQRDFEFATKYQIDIVQVISDKSKSISIKKEPYEKYGILVNSGKFDGLESQKAKSEITWWLKKQNDGDFEVNYKLRDWIFSRQRYWGEPIPLIHCEKCKIVPVPESELPVLLPEVDKYEPTGTGESPLASISEWVNTTCPKCKGPGKRETNTMPQWAGSCWYYLRFCDPKNDKELISKDIEKYWLNIDWYIGGAEHAVLHLLYARFWHKFLKDYGVIASNEPFYKLSSVGLVLGPDGQKMSKSKGNVIVPDDIVAEYGADTLRVYEAFMGPFSAAISWDPESINGVYKFLTRVWQVILQDDIDTPEKNDGKSSENETERFLAKTIGKVEKDLLEMKFNTSVAAMMEFVNFVFHKKLTKEQKKKFLIILSPFAPHLAEELWEKIGQEFSVHMESWPVFDKDILESGESVLVIQINGKVRAQFTIAKNAPEKDVIKRALGLEKISKLIGKNTVKKTIYISGKVLNFVI